MYREKKSKFGQYYNPHLDSAKNVQPHYLLIIKLYVLTFIEINHTLFRSNDTPLQESKIYRV